MKKEIDWNEKAFEINKEILVEAGVDYKAFTADQMIAFDLMSERLAVGLRYERMFKNLWKQVKSHDCCPYEPLCDNGEPADCDKCHRRFRKELEKK